MLHHSERIVSENVFSCDDAFEGAIAWIDNHHVSAMINSELFQALVELIMNGNLDGTLNHVGS